MKVKDLRKELDKFHDDMPVIIYDPFCDCRDEYIAVGSVSADPMYKNYYFGNYTESGHLNGVPTTAVVIT